MPAYAEWSRAKSAAWGKQKLNVKMSRIFGSTGQPLGLVFLSCQSWRRAELGALDFKPIPENLRKIGIDQSLCKSLEDCKSLAESIVCDSSKPFERMGFAIAFLRIPRQYHNAVLRRWS